MHTVDKHIADAEASHEVLERFNLVLGPAREEQRSTSPHPSGLNRKQRRALAKVR